MDKNKYTELNKRRKLLHSFYNSKEWQQVRAYCLMRDRYLCQKCGKPAEHVHHKTHLNESNVYDNNISLNPDNLVSLCKACHDKEHSGEHAGGRVANESYPYTFDENGMLILADGPRISEI